MRGIFIALCCALCALALADQVEQVNAGTEDIVPEATMEQVSGITDNWDDASDRAARRGDVKADSEGNNPITGQPMGDGDLGMKDTHTTYDPVMDRDFVHSPGYTPDDAQLTPHGHYYLGSGRRRIGAGFGRRRAPVQRHISKKEEKAALAKLTSPLFKDPTKMKSFLKFAHKYRSNYAADNGKAKAQVKALSKDQMKDLMAEMLGHERGPSFYASENYAGKHFAPGRSVKQVEDTGKIQDDDISSLKVPRGWCATVYTKTAYQGQSHKVCGPNDEWSLGEYPLTLKYGANSGGSKKDFLVIKGIRSYKTTWNDHTKSIRLTKYEWVLHQPTQKCVKTCGVDPHEYTGTITCKQTHGLEKAKTVDDKFCKMVQLTKPMLPMRRCPGTVTCVDFKTSQPTGTCPTNCGFLGSTLHGKVWCEVRARTAQDGTLPKEAKPSKVTAGKHVGDSVCTNWQQPKPATPTRACPQQAPCTRFVQGSPPGCPGKSCGSPANTEVGQVYCVEVNTGARTSDAACSHWGHAKPAQLTRYCAGGGRCCGRRGKCANDCCTFVARWAAPTNSCANCPFGNHHVWPRECGSSRKCDGSRL